MSTGGPTPFFLPFFLSSGSHTRLGGLIKKPGYWDANVWMALAIVVNYAGFRRLFVFTGTSMCGNKVRVVLAIAI